MGFLDDIEKVEEAEADSIADLVDPEREVGIPPEEYQPFVQPLPPGVYTVAKSPFVKSKGVDKDGHPWVRVNLIVTDEGEYNGRQLTAFFNTRPDKFRPKATSADDLLHAVGYQPYPRKAKDYLIAMTECAGIFRVKTDVSAECFDHVSEGLSRNETSVTGYNRFPFNADGSKQWEVACPTCGKAIIARTIVRRILTTRP